MDLEETKKIIQNKIEAEALTKNVRSQIKTYIHEKQNMREGFKETFKPLIESQDKVKESIDNQQNAMIKQLQENQLALTEGLDKNRLAITQGFDKMDDVKKWDLQQLPGYEAIEEPEDTDEYEEPEVDLKDENTMFKILAKDLNFTIGEEKYLGGWFEFKRKDLEDLMDKHGFTQQIRYKLVITDPDERTLRLEDREKDDGEKTKKGIVTFDDSDLDKGLFYTGAVKIFKNLDLPLPSKIIKEKYEVIKGFQNKAESLLNHYHNLLGKKAEFKTKQVISKAKPKK